MAFNSLSYLIFLPLVYLGFSLTKGRFRWLVLLFASYGFYATLKAPQLLVMLALVTAISYACGINLGRATEEGRRIRIFWTGAVGCLLVLVLSKCLPALLPFVKAEPPGSGLLISIGVSYFAFQAISYLADIYLRVQEPEQHLGYHALALAFFPKLLQGPIERAGDLLPQLKKSYVFDYDATRSGMLLLTFGLFKKVVIADRLALFVNPAYNDVHSYTGLPLIIATYAYALQIYFDFAGYTDMARGTARMFGIDLTENFNSPYQATSIADFWRRWHISFSRWILDYIFQPLQMAWRYQRQAGTALALMLTFLISGLWHGTSWGFVAWGALHGLYLAASTFYRPYQKRIYKRLGVAKSRWLKPWQVFVTFNLVSFSWIFFRAKSMGDAWHVVTSFAHPFPDGITLIKNAKEYVLHNVLIDQFYSEVIVILVVLSIFAAVKSTVKRAGARDLISYLEGSSILFRWTAYYAVIVSMVTLAVYDNSSFIYWQF